MRTAFIGAYGFGNLGDELCLIEALRAFPSTEAYALTVDPEWTMRCVPGLAGAFSSLPEMLALRPERVVFGGGGIGTSRTFADKLPWMALARAELGAELHVHNIGVGRLTGDTAWLNEKAHQLFDSLARFTVRDHKSVEMIGDAGIRRVPGLTFYPERELEPEFDLADALLPPQGASRLLGVSIINTPLMAACLAQEELRIAALLREFAGWTIVPVVSTVHVHAVEEDDATGFNNFVQRFLPRAKIAANLLLDRAFWRAELTPRRLRGLVSRCDALLTQRKHNAIHGIGSGVRTIGLHPRIDDSLRRTFVALAEVLPPGSRCVGLEGPAA